jgi:hypothetical protein
MTSFGLAAGRPRNSVLVSARSTLLPPLDHALRRYIHEAGYVQAPPVAAVERLEA